LCVQTSITLLKTARSYIFILSVLTVDVCSKDVDKMVSDAEAALGPIYMLVNCAGFSTPGRFEDLTMEQVKVCYLFIQKHLN